MKPPMGTRSFICVIAALSSWQIKEAKAGCVVYDIHGNNRKDVMECHTTAILSCTVPATYFADWYITTTGNASRTVAAQCSGNTCTVFNNFTGRYTYAYNSSDGVGNITIRNVSASDRMLEYQFDDGSHPPFFVPTMKAFPREETTNISYLTDKDFLSIEIQTDCATLSKNLSFIWGKRKNELGSEFEEFTLDEKSQRINISQNEILCDPKFDCGTKRFSSSVKFKPGNTGDKYHIICRVVVHDEYGEANITKISLDVYQFQDTTQSNDGKSSPLSDGAKVGIIIASIASGGVIIGVIVIIRCTKMGKKCFSRCKKCCECDPKK